MPEINFTETADELGVNHPMYVVFMDAIEQATGGKGQRHGGASIPFLDQRWHRIAQSTGFRSLVYQMCKKAEEACGKENYEDFERELLGAIVYGAMSLIHVRKHGYTREVTVDTPRKNSYSYQKAVIRASKSKKFEVVIPGGCGNGNDAMIGAFTTIEEAIAEASKYDVPETKTDG